MSKGVAFARANAPSIYRTRNPIIAVTGLGGTGKSVLIHQMCSPRTEYVPLPYRSVVVEKKISSSTTTRWTG